MTMTPKEVERKVKQLDNDMQALYEIVHRVSMTQVRHGNRLDEIQEQVSDVEDRLAARLDAHDLRFDGIDTQLAALTDSMAEVLRRLPG